MRRFFIVAALLLAPWPALAAGGLSIEPAYSSHSIGEVFTVRVRADTGGEPISAAQADISFDAGALAVENISTDGSILGTFSTGPSFSNDDGRIRFAGWTTEPYTGSDGLLLTITFKPLRNVVADVRFASGALLASDSRGSNVLERMNSALYAVGPREVVAELPEGVQEKIEANSGEVAGAKAERPDPPILQEYDAELAAGERIVVRGTTAPNGLVTLYTTFDEAVTEASVVSAADGTFTYVSNDGAEEGIYRVAADVETADGQRSERSDRVIITARRAGLAEAAAGALAFQPLSGKNASLLALIALLVLGAAAAGYIVHRRASVALRRDA